MKRYRALDLFCGAGGVSVGLERAGFDVVGVDIRPIPCHRGGVFIQADALTYPLEGFDFIWASPPCQKYSTLARMSLHKEYPDLIAATRERMPPGVLTCIENVPGAPLGSGGFLIMLCGTMFGLETLDGRAELRRHRLFETSWLIPLRPACQHASRRPSLAVAGHGSWNGKRTITVVGDKPNSANTPLKGVERHTTRTEFSITDARAAMGIDWMPMKYLSQAIPPAYAEWIGRQAIGYLNSRVG